MLSLSADKIPLPDKVWITRYVLPMFKKFSLNLSRIWRRMYWFSNLVHPTFLFARPTPSKSASKRVFQSLTNTKEGDFPRKAFSYLRNTRCTAPVSAYTTTRLKVQPSLSFTLRYTEQPISRYKHLLNNTDIHPPSIISRLR